MGHGVEANISKFIYFSRFTMDFGTWNFFSSRSYRYLLTPHFKFVFRIFLSQLFFIFDERRKRRISNRTWTESSTS